MNIAKYFLFPKLIHKEIRNIISGKVGKLLFFYANNIFTKKRNSQHYANNRFSGKVLGNFFL
jgi:hypothetical protein